MRKLLSIIASAALVLTIAPATLAVTDTTNSTTEVTVTASIELTGVPTAINFGSGVPGDTASATAFDAVITTNNAAGYKFEVTTSDLTGAALDAQTISASAVSYAVTSTDGTAGGGSVTDSATALQLGTKASESASSGDTYNVTPSLLIPFVQSDTYDGTADFVASSL